MTKRLPRLQLEARLTEKMEFYAGGAVAVNTLPNALLVELGLTEDDVDDISGFSREIARRRDRRHAARRPGWRQDLPALLAEIRRGRHLRRLGGGGHRRAAGASVPRASTPAKKAILQAIADSGVEL